MSGETTNIDLGTVLVVGGSGFVGGHCIRHVLRNGASKVHTLNSHVPSEEKRIPGVEYHTADLGDAAGVERVLQLTKPNVVIHTASPRPFIERPAVYERVNIQGVRNMLAACDKVGTTRAFVFCSSVSVIHDGDSDVRYADESWPVLYAPEQKEPYWHSKAMGEKLVLDHNRREGPQPMLTTALRVTSIFGEGDGQIIGGIVSQAKSGQLKTQIGDGRNRNDWTYVGTVAAAHTHAAKRLLRAALHAPDPPESRVDGEAFFVTNDDPRPFWDFVRQVAAEAGYPVDAAQVTKLPAFMAYVIGYVAEWVVFVQSFGRRKSTVSRRSMAFCVIDQIFSVDKARRQLGFVPTVGVDEAIRRSVASLQAPGNAESAKTK